ncbi:uncharacterized protein [Palaemon carinicauda]|uniref:uncharacterized protein isoform X2 n=1 Tax=Palaemon carinicauda TaxID=392227 RepID=UPI0035B69EE0
MKWLKITAVFVLMTLVKSGPTRNEAQDLGFPEDTLKSILINDGGLPPKQLLRLEGDMGDMTIEGGTCVSKEKTQYCSFSSTVTKYVPCDNTIPVCDKVLGPTTTDPATEGDLNSVILSYNDAKSATIKLKFDADHSTIPTLDVIAYYTDTSKNQLTNKGEGNKISGSFPGTETHNLIILLSSDGKVWTTNSAIIKDRELYATILGDDIIEGRWKILDDESTEKPTPETPAYLLTLTKDDGTVLVDSIAIDCANLETYCFGYFPITETGKYTLIVAHQTAAAGATYNELGQVESKPQEKKSSSEPELAILSRHTKRHANQLMADVNICFEHLTPTEGRSFSHYEMLIINEKGQWLKHRILEEEEEEREGRLCFTPFAINTKDFDLTEGTKVIVSQRGVDGFTVLATGESKLL